MNISLPSPSSWSCGWCWRTYANTVLSVFGTATFVAGLAGWSTKTGARRFANAILHITSDAMDEMGPSSEHLAASVALAHLLPGAAALRALSRGDDERSRAVALGQLSALFLGRFYVAYVAPNPELENGMERFAMAAPSLACGLLCAAAAYKDKPAGFSGTEYFEPPDGCDLERPRRPDAAVVAKDDVKK